MTKLTSSLPGHNHEARVRLAETPAEIEASQRIRYEVFYEEYGAVPTAHMLKTRLDQDKFDPHADHLIVESVMPEGSQVVGSYRLLPQKAADAVGQFYSQDEFDITPLLDSDLSLLELGRSCVLPDYRTRPVLQKLWQGVADYITERNIDLMFGCASLHTTSIDEAAEALSYLHHNHPCPDHLKPRALSARYIDMNIMPPADFNVRRVFASLPPIIKGYLRLGGTIGDGAVLDEEFGTIDVCVIVQTQLLSKRYRNHYERRMQRPMPGEKT